MHLKGVYDTAERGGVMINKAHSHLRRASVHVDALKVKRSGHLTIPFHIGGQRLLKCPELTLVLALDGTSAFLAHTLRLDKQCTLIGHITSPRQGGFNRNLI